MSQDARNSIYLWVGGIAFVLFFWAALKFRFASFVPDWFLYGWQGLVLCALLGQLCAWLWRRHVKRSEQNG